MRMVGDKVRYIVWGAGVRGKQALDFIGQENIVAFIDRDERLQRCGFCGNPVIDFLTYKAKYQNYLLIISFLESTETVQMLEKEGIYSFLLLDDVIY